jgi:hypothetical protein
MTTLPVKGIKIKDGKLVRVIRYATKNRKLKTDRLVKQWKGKGK